MQREIEGLEEGLGDSTIKDYIDVVPLTSTIDSNLQQSLEVLHNKKIGCKVKHSLRPPHFNGIKMNYSHV